VFISYAHADKEVVRRLVGLLADLGVRPIWDEQLSPGDGFTDQIQNFITNCHVFLPVFTPASVERPWTHQEIGFAMALGKPVLPVALGSLPVGIIGGIQALLLQPDLSDAPGRITAGTFRRLMTPPEDHTVTYQCTEDNARRALLLARLAEGILATQQHGTIRQRASLTSFHLPDRGVTDPVWRKYFPQDSDNTNLFASLRRERRALEEHARMGGCRLMLDPFHLLEGVYRKHGPSTVSARVAGLLAFLRDESIADVVVAINDDEKRTRSMTIVGDWFSSEAVSSGEQGILRESVFTRCVTVVQQHTQEFEQRMEELLDARGWTERTSRTEAISYLSTHLG
jgi:hypothetical protein